MFRRWGQGRHQRSGQLLTVQVPLAVGVQVSPSPPSRSLPVLFPRSSSQAARRRSLSPRQWEKSRSWKVSPRRDRQGATAQKKLHEEEVVEGERRLGQFQAEASEPAEVPPQVSELQRLIDALIRERDAVLTELETEPPVPNDPQELDCWLSDRNCDLGNAIEFGTQVSWVELDISLNRARDRDHKTSPMCP